MRFVDHMLVDQFCWMLLHGYIQGHLSVVCWRGSPCHITIGNSKNFVAVEMQTVNENWGLEWHANVPLAPWHSGLFERFPRCVKNSLKEEAQTQL